MKIQIAFFFLSMATCVFQDRGEEVFLLVGTVYQMRLYPREHAGGFVHVYRFIEEGTHLQLVHKVWGERFT